MRDCRMCASDERTATCIDYRAKKNSPASIHARTQRETHVQSLKVLAHFEHELLGAFLSLWETVVWFVCLRQREQRHGRRSQGEQTSNVLRVGVSFQLARLTREGMDQQTRSTSPSAYI